MLPKQIVFYHTCNRKSSLFLFFYFLFLKIV